MRDRISELGAATDVVMITFTTPSDLAHYQARSVLPFPTLIDADRTAYRAYGLGRGSVARVWGVSAGRRYLELFRTDGLRGVRKPTEDTLQLGGDFVIGPDGSLAYGFWGAGPDDRPTVDDLIAATQRC